MAVQKDSVVQLLNGNRPLVVFDIESTGTNPRMDRIIDIAFVKISPDGVRKEQTYRLNPEIPIPPESTVIHGIRDEDVAGMPTFRQVAEEISGFLCDCDLGGYNMIRFDLPMLGTEFKRIGITFSEEGRNLLDMQRIFHIKEPRDLSAALQFYCGEMHLDAHGALDDVNATIRVLQGQLERYPDLPKDLEELHRFCNPQRPDWVDKTGRLRWTHGEAAINFGKNQGRSLKSLIQKESGFLHWILDNDFPEDTKGIIRNALRGEYPTKPA